MPPDRNLNCRKCLSPRASYRNISGCEWASLEIEITAGAQAMLYQT
jgi:hypothetical protein